MKFLMLLAALILPLGTVYADEPIRIGVTFGFSGIEAYSPTVEYRGVEMATEEANAAGGIRGRKIELVKYDTHQTVPDTFAAINKALGDKLVAIIGEVQSPYALVEAPIAEERKSVLMVPHATHVDITKDKKYVFRACFNDNAQGTALAYFASKILSAKKIAVFTNVSNNYSIGLSDIFKLKVESLGARVVAQEKYLTEQSDFKDQIKDAMSKNPDVFFIPGYNFDSTLIIQQAINLGYKGAFLGGDGWDDVSTFVNLLKANDVSRTPLYAATHWHTGIRDAKSEAFVKKYYNRFGENPLTMAAIGYDTANLLFTSLKLSGDFSADTIRDVLHTMPAFSGITGKIVYHGAQEPVKDVVMMKFKPKGFEYDSTLRCEAGTSKPVCEFKKL